jgi:ribonucleoside-diphosphate reductase subunit M1
MESFYSRTFEDAEKIKQHSKAKFCTKRDGSKQSIEINSIKERLEALCFELETKYLNLNVITYRVVQGLYEGITTQEIDNLAAETCAYMNIIHPHYSILGIQF